MVKIIERVYKAMSNNKYLILAFAIMFISIYIFNRKFPLMIDDWMYNFIFGQTPLTKVNSLSDIIQSQYNHYMQWGGRTIVHIIAQLLIWMPPLLHDLLNTAVFVGLLYLIYYISNYRKKTNIWLLIIICTLFWFLEPSFASTMFWITGSANYLWGSLIILLFIYPYYLHYIKEKSSDCILKIIGFFFFGIIAGWTNENMSIALIFIIIALIIIYKKKQVNIPRWAIVGLIGVIIGCIFMLLAPGNYIRYESEMIDRDLQGNSLFSLEVLLPRLSFMAWLYLKRVFILVLPCLILMYFYKKQDWKASKKKTFTIAALFLIAAHVAFWAMLASPGFPNRALFGIIILIIISIGLILSDMKFDTIKSHVIITLISFLSLVSIAIDYGIKLNTVRRISETLEIRENIIEEGKKKGQKDFIFTNRLDLRSRYFFSDCTEDPNFWINKLYSDYYGINSVKVFKEEEKQHNE